MPREGFKYTTNMLWFFSQNIPPASKKMQLRDFLSWRRCRLCIKQDSGDFPSTNLSIVPRLITKEETETLQTILMIRCQPMQGKESKLVHLHLKARSEKAPFLPLTTKSWFINKSFAVKSFPWLNGTALTSLEGLFQHYRLNELVH